MKLIILIALIALATAAPIDDKKPAEKPVSNQENKKPAADVEIKEEIVDIVEIKEKPDERKGLRWPLPDPIDEGDLILHGSHLFDRVEELHKTKVETEEDKMILSVGRDYLRRVHEYIKKTPDFKILPDLCRDSDHLNSTKRWEIRIRPTIFVSETVTYIEWVFGPSTDGQQQKQSAHQPDQIQGAPAKNTKQNDPIVFPSNSTHENVTDTPSNSTDIVTDTPIVLPSNSSHENVTDFPMIDMNRKDDFETKRDEYYKHVGNNFAHLLLKKYRKEKLDKEEIDYLDHWSNEESIHYGMMGIYCHEGENIEEITKRMGILIDEKQ